MEIKIGESLFLGGNSVYKIAPPVSGLRSPAIRTLDGLRFTRDGGYVSGHYYGHRTITIRGFYNGENCDDAIELRKTLLSYLRIRYKLPIRVTTRAGQFNTEGYVVDVKADIENLVSGEFQITLQCPDPYFYESLMGVVYWYTEPLDDGITGRNLFNKAATPNRINGTMSAFEIDTGVKCVNNTTRTGGVWNSACYIIGEAEKYSGKKITMTYTSSVHGETIQPANAQTYIGLANANASTRVSKIGAGGSGNKTVQWTVTPDSSTPYLLLWFYAGSGSNITVTQGDYAQYDNIMVSISDTAQPYIPYDAPVGKTITNLGGVDSYPKITVTGIVDGIEVRNATTGLTMYVDVETESVEDEVIIDMANRQILYNGSQINENRSLDSAWWCLVPGENNIETSIGDNATAEIKYRKGFAGI